MGTRRRRPTSSPPGEPIGDRFTLALDVFSSPPAAMNAPIGSPNETAAEFLLLPPTHLQGGGRLGAAGQQAA